MDGMLRLDDATGYNRMGLVAISPDLCHPPPSDGPSSSSISRSPPTPLLFLCLPLGGFPDMRPPVRKLCPASAEAAPRLCRMPPTLPNRSVKRMETWQQISWKISEDLPSIS